LKHQLGDIQNGLGDSLILNLNETFLLLKTTQSSNATLLYRATQDGFTAQAFHSKCDYKKNTLVIIRTNLDYVFGGYTSVEWTSNDTYEIDPSAFIFSMRKCQVTDFKKFNIKPSCVSNAIYSSGVCSVIFGSGHDIKINENSNTNTESFTNFGGTYQLPEGLVYDDNDAKNYLAGNYNGWLTTEIEVYQIY
jgi:hypothetical protein